MTECVSGHPRWAYSAPELPGHDWPKAIITLAFSRSRIRRAGSRPGTSPTARG
jgi:hypothetical protein